MGKLKTKTMNVNDDIKLYVESIRKEIHASFHAKFDKFKFEVVTKFNKKWSRRLRVQTSRYLVSVRIIL